MDRSRTASQGTLLLLGNAFFVAFAFTGVPQFDDEGFQHAGLRRAWQMTEQLEIYLSGCQVGITIRIGLGVVGGPWVTHLFGTLFPEGGIGTAAALVPVDLLHVVVGEQAPLYIGIERTRTIIRHLAPGLY